MGAIFANDEIRPLSDKCCGYTISNDYIPEVYTINGKEQMGDDIDDNATALQYYNYNFSRRGANNERVKINFEGINLLLGLSIHL